MYRITLFLILYQAFLFGQSKSPVDSLLHIVQNPKAVDTAKIDAYTNLVYHYMYTNSDSTLYFSKKLFQYSEANNSNLGRYYSNYSKAFYFFTTSNFDSVIHHLEQSINYAQKMNNLQMVGEGHSKLSGVYGMLNQKEKALFHANQTLKFAEKNKDWIGVGYAYLNLGDIHFYSEEYDLAITDYQKVDSILSIHKPLDITHGNALINIGLIFLNRQQHDKAETYLNNAYALFEEMDYTNGMQVIKGHLGKLHLEQKRYDEAVKELSSSVVYFREIGDDFKLSQQYTLLGNAYFQLDKKDRAFESLGQARQLKEKVKDTLGLLETITTLGNLRLQNNEPQKSLEFANEALLLSKKVGSLVSEKNALLLMAESNAALKRFEQSYTNYKAFRIVNDSLLKIQNLEEVQELEAKYQTDQKVQEIELLTTQKELISKQKENQKILLLGGLGITTLAGIFFFFLYRNRQKTASKLKELDAVKSNFFANISHEFRTPLTLISGPIEKKLAQEDLTSEDRKEFEMVYRNSNRLVNLVDQLLDLSKLESGNLKLHIKEGNLSLFMRSLVASFEHIAQTQEIDYSANIDEITTAWFDQDALEKIATNLLSNAFKYATIKGEVQLILRMKEDILELKVYNTGEIKEEEIATIFNRFYQKDERAGGFGIGLALVKELVALYRGRVLAENTPDKKVVFTVQLPYLQEQFSASEIVTQTLEPLEKEELMVTTLPKVADSEMILNEDAPILLVVDDHEDIRNFVRSSFQKDYQVIEAIDGEDGIEKALKNLPDIIISDIMMPRISGIELCKTLKSDEKTSHIPILLLTAKAEEQTQYEGLETGADDYLVKPFKVKMLETRVKNLVDSRSKLRERYSQEVVLKPFNIAISRLDEKFIEKLQEVMDTHLTNPDFSVEDFSKTVGMSRMQLHRKLKALTGITASEYLRNERLKLAANLLQHSDVNISEICYQVGFNNPSYFTKCFKELYGCLPSEFSSK